MINCPNCNTANSDDAASCSNCGAALSESLYRAPATPTEGVPPEFLDIPEPSPKYSGSDGPEVEDPQQEPEPTQKAPAPSPAGSPLTVGSLVAVSAVPKDRNLALILEIMPGFFGLLGIGWIYSGNTPVGIAWLLGYGLWNLIALILAIFTAGISCFCALPVNIIAMITSALLLNGYIQKNAEKFK
jgi:hypothetical protein